MKTAGEGGAYGIALLALYRILKTGTLEEFLDAIFIDSEKTSVCATCEEKEKFANFIARYKQGLFVEKSAEKHFKL